MRGGDLPKKVSPLTNFAFIIPQSHAPYAEAIDDELGDLLMLGLAVPSDAHGRTEFKVDGLFDIHRAGNL